MIAPLAAPTRGARSVRSVLVGAVGVGLAVLFGDPVLVVLVAPMLVLAALGLLHRPSVRTAAVELRSTT